MKADTDHSLDICTDIVARVAPIVCKGEELLREPADE